MTKFDMDINHNFASFKLNDKMIFVESFDNQNFEVRAGTSEISNYIGNITAQSSDELNFKLEALVKI